MVTRTMNTSQTSGEATLPTTGSSTVLSSGLVNAKYSIQPDSTTKIAAAISAAMPGFSVWRLSNCSLNTPSAVSAAIRVSTAPTVLIALMKLVVIATARASAPCSTTDHTGGRPSSPANTVGK